MYKEARHSRVPFTLRVQERESSSLKQYRWPRPASRLFQSHLLPARALRGRNDDF